MDYKLPTIREIGNRLNVFVSIISWELSNHQRIDLCIIMQVQELRQDEKKFIRLA